MYEQTEPGKRGFRRVHVESKAVAHVGNEKMCDTVVCYRKPSDSGEKKKYTTNARVTADDVPRVFFAVCTVTIRRKTTRVRRSRAFRQLSLHRTLPVIHQWGPKYRFRQSRRD